MKNVSQIISHISKDPLFSSLQKAQNYKKLMQFFPQSIKDGVLYMYNKNDTLFITFSHQGYWMEFNNFSKKYFQEHKQNYIKSLLNQLIKIDPQSKCIDALHVKTFYKNVPFCHEKQQNESLPFFHERSNGEFKNNAKDPKIHTLFEEIRNIIVASGD